ncbi:MAG: acyloxyacyl hydrolase [Gammaproteobacteria bacterium]|nr:acyloxyacyl hydrolase [Gammaproteobacteria bacterium]
MRLVLILMILLSSVFSHAADGLFVSVGSGMGDALIQSGSTSSASVKGAGIRQLGFEGVEFPHLGEFDVTWDLEWYQLQHQQQSTPLTLTIWAVKPTLLWSWPEIGNTVTEFGLGVGHLSSTEYLMIQTSSHLQFAIHLGVGWQFGEAEQWRTILRYNHYSNGYLDQPNPGVDFMSLSLYYQF